MLMLIKIEPEEMENSLLVVLTSMLSALILTHYKIISRLKVFS